MSCLHKCMIAAFIDKLSKLYQGTIWASRDLNYVPSSRLDGHALRHPTIKRGKMGPP